LILARRRRELLDVLWPEVVVFKTDTSRMQRMIVIAFFQQLAVLSSAFMQLHGLLFLFLLYRKRNIDFLPGSRHRDTGISANRPGCHVIAKFIFVAFNKRAEIAAN